ncbi:MAG: NAD-dependent protein deacylase 1 [Candidatus Heimdallarchaeota archaeon LC_3]|nr:MAG: NAD-dependent protein deacylase 1 [Candidatus Heimdallarchaeota archaeon LC_3]
MTDINKVIATMATSKHIVILTGAGISAESGIPTFRGNDGYWKKGSKNYHPMELATLSTFHQQPELVWEWYHYRRGVCKDASPNPGHYASAKLEKLINSAVGKKFHLITQNVDGLHLRAGSTLEKTYQIHGNTNYMRCVNSCTNSLYNIPDDEQLPHCPECEALARPHVLWFDEVYDETFFKIQTVSHLASGLDILFVVGTTLQTTLPYRVVMTALNRKVPVVEINPEPTGIGERGLALFKEKSGEILPKIVDEYEKVIK